MEIDRISSLPDTTLSEILSYLDTDEALRTKILSKQWQHIWFPTEQPAVFSLTSENSTDLYLTGIADFVSRTLPLELRLKDTRNYFNKSDLDLEEDLIFRGVTADVVLKHDIPDYCSGYFDYSIFEKLFSYAEPESLTLQRHCGIESPSKICWTSLKTIIIECPHLDHITDKAIENIVERCPNLERLELNLCEGFNSIPRSSGGSCCLRNLVSYSKSMDVTNVQFIKVSSLVDVIVDFQSLNTDPYTTKMNLYFSKFSPKYSSKNKAVANEWLLTDEKVSHHKSDRRHILIEFLNKQVGHAERVQLGTWCVKAVSSYAMRGLPSPLSLSKWKCLVLQTPLDGWDIPGILTLLRSSPDLETLVIDLTAGTGYNAQFSPGNKIGTINARTYWKKQNNISGQFLVHLKHVKIVGVSSRLLGFVQFLLQNATFLEKMELTKCNENDDQLLVVQNISRLPTPSSKTKIFVS